MLYRIQQGEIDLISNKIFEVLTRYAANKENKTSSCLLELQDLLFNNNDGIFRGGKINYRISSAELKGRKLLDDLRISYLENVTIERILGPMQIDVIIPYKDAIGKDIAIEWDGDYWHCNPKKFKTPTSTQSYIKECDRAKEECLKNTDYLLLRFYESDLDDNAISVKKEIWQAMCNTPRIPEEGQEKLDQQFKITK
jgi:hypothetical protein